jgi:hypothetical protein
MGEKVFTRPLFPGLLAVCRPALTGGFLLFWAILSKWLMPKASRLAGRLDSCITKF